jgi:hypothetical protein
VTLANTSRNTDGRDWDRYHRDYLNAKEKLDKFKTWWWVPIYGQILVIRELFEWNAIRMNEADSRKSSASHDKAAAERRRAKASSMVTEAKEALKRAERELEDCRRRKAECHQKCTDLKEQISTISQGEKALNDILCLTESACSNTDEVKAIFDKSRGSIKLLQSRGTKAKIWHVGERWMGVNDMVSSNRGLLKNRALTGAM